MVLAGLGELYEFAQIQLEVRPTDAPVGVELVAAEGEPVAQVNVVGPPGRWRGVAGQERTGQPDRVGVFIERDRVVGVRHGRAPSWAPPPYRTPCHWSTLLAFDGSYPRRRPIGWIATASAGVAMPADPWPDLEYSKSQVKKAARSFAAIGSKS